MIHINIYIKVNERIESRPNKDSYNVVKGILSPITTITYPCPLYLFTILKIGKEIIRGKDIVIGGKGESISKGIKSGQNNYLSLLLILDKVQELMQERYILS